MAHSTLSAANAHASPNTFNLALAAYRRADRQVTARSTKSNRSAFSRTAGRLLATPAPNVRALVAKLEALDPFDLDQFEALLADARRLAAA